MKDSGKMILFGALIWLIMFALAMVIWPLYEMDQVLFKSIMVVTSTITGMFFIIKAFSKERENCRARGIRLGILWFAINILLDLIVLVALMGTPLMEYITGVGLRYLNIITMCAGAGILLNKIKTKEPELGKA